MFIEAIILGIILGFIRKGRFSNLRLFKINGWVLIILAFLAQIMPLFTEKISFIEPYTRYSYIISMVFVLIVVLMNMGKKGFPIFLVGVILNLLVVIMNDFKMPIYFEGLRLAGMDYMIDAINNGEIINYMPLDKVTDWTKYLAKFIVIPRPYPLAKVISVGDILMSLGIIFLLQGEMVKSYLSAKGRMIRLGYKTKI